MSIFSKIKDWFTGGSSKKSKSSTRRAKTVSNYGGGGSRSVRDSYGTAVSRAKQNREDEEKRRRQEAQRKQQQRTDALKQMAQRTDALSSGKTTSSVTGMQTSGSGRTRAVAKSLSGVERVTQKIGEKTKSVPPDPKVAQVKKSREDATKALNSLAKNVRVKTPEEMVKSGDYEFRSQAKNMNTPSSDSRSTTRLSLQGYKKRMENEAYRQAESAARGLGGDATFGVVDILMRGNKDDKTEQDIEKYYQEHKSKGAETAGRIVGSLLGFGMTEKAASTLAKEVAPEFLKRGGQNTVQRLATNSAFRKAARKEAERAGVAITDDVIERFALQRAQRLVDAISADMAINVTTGGLMDVNQSLRETYDENNGEFNWGDFAKNMGGNAAMNLGLGGAVTVLPALRTTKGFLNIRARDDAVDLAKRINMDNMRGAMTDAFVRNGDNVGRRIDMNQLLEKNLKESTDALTPISLSSKAENMEQMRRAMRNAFAQDADEARRIDMNSILAQNSPFRQADEAIRPQTVDDTVNAVEQPLVREATPPVAEAPMSEQAIKDEAARAVTEEFKNTAPKSRADERDALRKEYLDLKHELEDEWRRFNEGDASINAYDIEERGKRLDELDTQIKEIEREIGSQPQERKVRADKGKPRNKATPPDVAETTKQAEPRKYEDIDLSEGLTKEDRSVIRSRMKELEAERNTLEATDPDNPKILELNSEISTIKRALKRKTGEPAKKVNLAELNAQKAAKEAEEKAARNANAKPIENKPPKAEEPKVEKAKAEKATPPESKKQKVINEEKEHESTVREAHEKLAEAGKTLRKATDGKYNVRGSTNTAVELGSTEQNKRYIKEAEKLIKDYEQGLVDSSVTYKVMTREERDKVAKDAFIRARKSPDAILTRLETAVKDDDVLDINDIADMNAVTSLYHELGEKMPPEVEELAGRVQMQALTEKAQGLKSISLFLRENDPVYRKRYLNKDLAKFREVVCGEGDWQKISASLDKKHKMTGYLDAEIKKLAEMTGTENEEAFRKAYVNLQREIWRNSEPTRWELLNLVRHTFMLGAFKTSDNNLIGNLSQSSMWEVSDKLDALAEAMMSKTRKGKDMRRTTTVKVKNNDLTKFMNQIRSGSVAEKFEELGAKPKAYGDKQLGELLENARAEDVGDAMGTSKYGFKADKGWDYEYSSKLKKWTRRMVQAPAKAVGFMLSEPDSWFVERNYRKALARYLDVNGITTAKLWENNPELVSEARKYAKDVALENTYKKGARLVSFLEGQRAKGYRKDAKWSDVLKTIGLDAELPYLRVPYNLVVNNFKYSPVGLAKNAGSAAHAMFKGDVDALNKAVKEMSKGLTGTGLMIAGFYLNCDDQMDDDSWGFIGKANEHLKEYGIRDNSLKIGNHNYNLANFGIGTVQFLMGARLAEDLNEIGGAPESFLDYPEAVASAFGTTFDVISDMSLMENGLAIFDAISNAGDYDMNLSERMYNVTAKVAGDYTGQYIPQPARAYARAFTSSDLDTGVKKGKATSRGQRTLQRNVNNVISSVPVVNEKVLPHKVDRHGNYVNERKTEADKWKAFGTNLTNPFNPREVNIPEADKVEMQLVQENGKAFQPKGFDENREYKAKIGQGKHAETFDLTGKEREQAARSYKNSGYDMADNIVYSTNAWFGDSHGKRAQEILSNIPEDEQAARTYLYKTPEFQKLSSDQKLKFMKELYDARKGRGRTANHEVYVNIKGGDEGDFRYQNDLAWQQQDKYEEYKLSEYGISKGQWADIIEAARYESHKYTDDGKNKDVINSAYKLKQALMSIDGLSAEARVAAYQAYRGKRNGFGWYDWDGESMKSGYRRRRFRRWRRWHRWGGGGGSSAKATVPKPKALKMSDYIMGEALTSKSSSSKTSSKVTPPKLKRVESKIALPTRKEY